MTRALTLWLYRKEFPQRQKTVKQVKYLLRGKEYNMCGYRHSGRLRRRIFASLNQLRGALLPGFPWPIILICLVHSLYLLHLRTLPEKAMATHSSTLAWKMLWTEESGRLQFMGSLGVRHDWATSLWLFTFMHWRRKRQPTPVFLPGESQGRGSLVGCRLWGRTESDTTKAT